MTSNGWNAWRAQTPPSDFAARAAAAVVRDHHERRRRSTRRRWVAAAMLAAAMIGGSALALTGLRAKTELKREVVQFQGKGGVVQFQGKGGPYQGKGGPPSPPPEMVWPAPAPPVSAPTVRPKKREAPPVSSAPADAGRPVITPRCNCQQGQVLCDCIE
jgi:hypothetical protein